MCKRFLLAFLVLSVLLFTTSQSFGATLITDSNKVGTGAPQVIPISKIESSTRRHDVTNNIIFNADNLLDGNARTTWQPTIKSYDDFYANGVGEYLNLTFARRAKVTEIWIRNGHCRDESYYLRNSRPAVLTVSFKMRQGNQYVTITQPLTYQMEDVFDPTTYNEFWRDGYQCLRLPEPIEADAITITIDSLFSSVYNQGRNNWYYVCMSDLYVVGE